mmetsp:Transcript_29860/g.93318  ORF Transcript_29860/g.93318 Transcript_29860/m.93318 type:complete len:283 (+) Transcript_29860:1119-1967(+)
MQHPWCRRWEASDGATPAARPAGAPALLSRRSSSPSVRPAAAASPPPQARRWPSGAPPRHCPQARRARSWPLKRCWRPWRHARPPMLRWPARRAPRWRPSPVRTPASAAGCERACSGPWSPKPPAARQRRRRCFSGWPRQGACRMPWASWLPWRAPRQWRVPWHCARQTARFSLPVPRCWHRLTTARRSCGLRTPLPGQWHSPRPQPQLRASAQMRRSCSKPAPRSRRPLSTAVLQSQRNHWRSNAQRQLGVGWCMPVPSAWPRPPWPRQVLLPERRAAGLT